MVEEKKVHPFVMTLRETRMERRISQIEMAASVDSNGASLSNYETGVSSPRLDMFQDWAYALDYELTMTKIEKPTRGRRKTSAPDAPDDDIPEGLAVVHLSRYQTALAMGILIGQSGAMRTDSPGMSADLQVVADILARSLH